MANNEPSMFDEITVLNDQATLFLSWFERHIHNGRHIKFGWARASGFEIRDSVTDPEEVYQSAKDSDTHYYVREVGQVGAQKWYTVTFLDRIEGRVTTAYNTVTYAQKGHRIWP